MGRLQDKVAIITGAGGGIGAEVARRFADEGAVVSLVDINEQALKQVQQEIQDNNGRCEIFVADVGNEQDIIKVVDETDAKYRRLDILHTNTFWANYDHVENTSLDEWNKTMQITLTAPFLFSKYAIPVMRRSGGGSIIHMSSTGGVVAFRNHAAYIVAKAGIIQLCKSLAVDFGKDGIRSNAICPGIIETPATIDDLENPEKRAYLDEKCLLGRIGTPGDIAGASIFLASADSEFITGSILTVDSGWSII